MDELKKVSFIIRTLNEGKTLNEALKRIHLLQDNYGKEIVIVDSGSTDNTLQISEKHGAKIVKISKEKWSWGRALNLGIENCTGDYIVLISGHCFISTKDFLIKSISLLENKEVAAVYGKQLAIPNIDPFEEYELYSWYPDLDLYKMNFNILTKGKGKGISNACCVLKKSAWLNVKYNEEVNIFEDLLWALNITKFGYNLCYSNRFSVYHSHLFNVAYIYRKWYWRYFEGLNFEYNYLENFNNIIKVSLKKFLRYVILKKYFNLKSIREKKILKKIVYKYPFISARHLDIFLKIRNKAMLNSHKDFSCNIKTGYWTLKIPEEVIEYQNELLTIEQHLDKNYFLLELMK